MLQATKAIIIYLLIEFGLLLLGVALLITGNIFKLMKWHDAFHGNYSGPIILALSLVSFFCYCVYATITLKPEDGMVFLSSRVTFFIKYFSFYYITTIWLTSSVLAFFSKYSHYILMIIFIFFMFLTILVALFVSKINMVETAHNSLIILNKNKLICLDFSHLRKGLFI